MKDQINLSDKSKISMPIANLIMVIALVASTVFGYSALTNRITALETQDTLMTSDLLKKAQQEPKNLNSLESIRGVETRHLKNSFPKEIFAKLKSAKELEPLPQKEKQGKDKSKDLRAGVTLVSAWVAQAARQLDLDPAILGTRSDEKH